jgi:hypothetical protein
MRYRSESWSTHDHKKEDEMQYVLLINQGSAWATIPDRSEDEKRSIEAEYAALSAMPEIIPGPPLGLPHNATTVRVQDGTTLITDGPFCRHRGSCRRIPHP